MRWSYLNYYNPNKFDYTIFDASATDVYYNSASILDISAVLEIEDETENITESAIVGRKTGIHFAVSTTKVLIS